MDPKQFIATPPGMLVGIPRDPITATNTLSYQTHCHPTGSFPPDFGPHWPTQNNNSESWKDLAAVYPTLESFCALWRIVKPSSHHDWKALT